MGLFKKEEIKEYEKQRSVSKYNLLPDNFKGQITGALIKFRENGCEEDNTVDPQIVSLHKALKGDYNEMQKLSPIFKDYLINCYIQDFRSNEMKISLSNDEFVKRLENNLLNPVYQEALDKYKIFVSNSPDKDKKAKLANIDAAIGYMNTRILENSLNPLGEAEKDNLMDKYIEIEYKRLEKSGKTAVNLAEVENQINNQIEENERKQLYMAQTLFLTHLGDLKLKGYDKDVEKDYDSTMGELFGHGGRVLYTIPRLGSEHVDPTESYYGHISDIRVLKDRKCATHNVSAREVKIKKGYVKKYYDEKKVVVSISDNHYINPAIGGMGKTFGKNYEGSQQIVEPDGLNGHMYIKLGKPEADKEGYMLIGIEGEQSGIGKGRYGHKHDSSAEKSDVSAFGATKHGLGAEINGRVVDLSNYKADELRNKIEWFKDEYSTLQNSAKNNPEDRKKLEFINKRLSGYKMDQDDLGTLFADVPQVQQNYDQKLRDALTTAGQKRVVNPEFYRFNDLLGKSKRKVFRYIEVNSGQMKDIKKALKKIMDYDVSGDRKKYLENIQKLIDACNEYLKPSNKKNKTTKRYAIVKNLLKFSQQEMDWSKKEPTSFNELWEQDVEAKSVNAAKEKLVEKSGEKFKAGKKPEEKDNKFELQNGMGEKYNY